MDDPVSPIASPEEPQPAERNARSTEWEDALIPQTIRAEANLLRLPLFALHTKGLKTLDGIECRGRITRDGETHQFTYRATRNTATFYPGPLARAAHLAFLSIITDHGFPLQNPITWSWHDLCRRMRIQCGGQIVKHLKNAITSTAGLLIHSEYALYSKREGQPICTRADALHLYDRVAFLGSRLPDGSVADHNYLWLSPWYLENLNARFTAPLDFNLWRYLDERSSIASRLYEFLLPNFYSGAPVLRINYGTLTQFLPIRAERYRSLAVRQLTPAFKLLQGASIIAAAAWTESKDGLAQLQIYPGKLLATNNVSSEAALSFAQNDAFDVVEVRELRNVPLPERELVAGFYRLWANTDTVKPSKKELTMAQELVSQHGAARAKALVALAVQSMKVNFPDAKTFGALTRYIPDALKAFEHQQLIAESRKIEEENSQREREEQSRLHAQTEHGRAVWVRLSAEEQATIRDELISKNARMQLHKHPNMLERMCIREAGARFPQESTGLIANGSENK